MSSILFIDKHLYNLDMKHAFTHDILLVNDAFSLNKELIEVANTINAYGAAQVANNEHEGYTSDTRTNSRFGVDPKLYPPLQPFIDELDKSIQKAKEIYLSYNKYMYANTNFGYDILKYEPGQYFDEHVDLIPGHACFQNRQLSILIYLNDNYIGGETFFPRQELQLKPPAGSMALFPPFYTHPHISKPIISGTKYIAVTWLYP
jgi:hypothetical protein